MSTQKPTILSIAGTRAQKFFDDPRITQAQQLIREALADHQKDITSLTPAKSELKENYEQMIKELSAGRGGALYYNYIGSGFGRGPFVELCDGSLKYDFITGIGVHYFGHSHPDVIEAAVQGAIGNTVMQGHLQQNSNQNEMIQLLSEQVQKKGSAIKHVFLTSSGAMANENALKLAFQKRYPANRVLAFERSFSGRTLALSFITDKAAYREGLPQGLQVDYLPFYDVTNHEKSIKDATYALKKYIKRFPKQHACIFFEPIQGEGGSWEGNEEYFKALFTIAKENHISIISDEVQAFGRTQELFAFQYYNLAQYVDIVTIGKMSQVCATLFAEDHKPRPGLLSQTFTSSGVAINTGYKIIKSLVEDNFLGPKGKIQTLGDYFRVQLKKIESELPHLIQGPYGVGAMVAMTVFKGDAELNKKFSYRLFDLGVLTFTAGGDPTRVRFLMPIGAVEEKDIDEVCKIVKVALLSVSEK
ncbi:MAG: aminotransferase class III-fold pyridoxal phosphate-dependent enzyme [Bacteriovoracaceae bacterium]|nr:aminotransferase class III-fold pyridoxal phosphate-dependent enzyme [Bacteriovoracaceae bacterium]